MSLLGSKSAKKKKGDDAPLDTAKPGKADKKAAKAAAAAAKAQSKAAAKSAGAAAGRGVVVEKPKANIYTALLALSFVAIVVACICLYAEMNAYEWKLK
jgi:hypothetical protein